MSGYSALLQESSKRSPGFPGRPYTVYKIEIAHEGQVWYVYRRYSSFLALYESLAASEPQLRAAVKFPAKVPLWSSMSASVVAQRERGLKAFLRTVTKPQTGGGPGTFSFDLSENPELKRFLDFENPDDESSSVNILDSLVDNYAPSVSMSSYDGAGP